MLSPPLGPVAPLSTARLLLRPVQPDDAAELVAALTPAISQRLLSWPFPFTPTLAHERIARARARAAEGLALPFIMERRADRAFIGWLSITRADASAPDALLSYWLGEHHHGHGYMKEAVPAALAAAFAALDIDVIKAEVQPDNAASLSVLRSCGLIRVREKTSFAPSRGRDEPCILHELRRAAHLPV